jgi:hypothetical protein
VWTNGTLNPGNAIISNTDTGATAKTFAGGGQTYGTLRHTATGTAALTITGNNTFANLDLECTTARTITLPANGTQTVTGLLTLSGASGQNLSLVSSTPGTKTTIIAKGTLTESFYTRSSDVVFDEYATAALTGLGSSTIAGIQTQFGNIGFLGNGTITTSGVRTRFGEANLTGLGYETITGVHTCVGAINFFGTGTLTSGGTRTRFGNISFDGVGDFFALGVQTQFGSIAFLGNSDFSSAGVRTRFGECSLYGSSGFSADAVADHHGAAVFTGLGFLLAAGIQTQFGNIVFIGLGSSVFEYRVFVTGKEEQYLLAAGDKIWSSELLKARM